MAKRLLILENGKVFSGEGFGASGEKIAEIVFNTSMVGYQEILYDPAYYQQIVVMSYPLIGNYGVNDDDFESKSIYMAGFVVHEYNDRPSNFRYTMTLQDMMQENGVVGICGLDTRELVKILRDEGSMRAMITDEGADIAECVEKIKSTRLETRQVEKVTTHKVWHCRTRNPKYSVAAIDLGLKYNVIKKLNDESCNVIVYPAFTSAEDILSYHPQGLFISDGPGSPEDIPEVVETVRKLKGKLPIFGVGLGQLVIALAMGAKVKKAKVGHRGVNIPVRDLRTNTIDITAQNHCFAVDAQSIDGTGLTVTHINVLDGDIEGIEDKENKIIGVMFRPDKAAMPKRAPYVFDTFAEYLNMSGGKGYAQKNRY